MYIEVSFQRNTSQSLQIEAAVFRLWQNEKNLEKSGYAVNLSLYFDQSRIVWNLILRHLRNVLTSLSGTQENPNVKTQQLPIRSESSSESIEKQPVSEYGEQVACVWYNDGLNCLRWHLEEVDAINSGELLISYMKISDKKGLKWLFPDEAEIQSTKFDQILLHINVSYTLTAMIRWEITSDKLQKIEKLFKKFKEWNFEYLYSFYLSYFIISGHSW